MEKLLGIDLGGTTVKFAILTKDGQFEHKWSINTDISDEGKYIVPNIIESIKQQLELYGLTTGDFIGIGMGSPGSVNQKEGTVIGAYNLNWRTLQSIKEKMEAALNLPFYIDNDANVAALGEQWKGAGEGGSNVAFITLGTGVGGGIVAEGNMIHGIGAAGEIGHMNVEPNGYECTCGNIGCLETVASATGIVRLAKDFAKDFVGDSKLKVWMDEGKEVTAKIVFDEAKQGDKLAEAVLDRFYYYLGLACSSIANILHPETIVLGGGVSAAGEVLIKGVEKYFNKYAFPQIRTGTKIKLAELGNDAGVIGAASLVRMYEE